MIKCKYCGKNVIHIKYDTTYEVFYAHCITCDEIVSGGETEESAMRNWNNANR